MKEEKDFGAGLIHQVASPLAETEPRPNCEWRIDEDGIWDGACGAKWEFLADGPKANNMRFCPECGGRVKVVEPNESLS